MKHALIGLVLTGAVAAAPAANAQVSFSIGINVPTYPSLVPIPNYPVYYAPNLGANYFFYDGLYWVFANDTWYQSEWYNGPWAAVDPYYIPAALLQVPVRYYRVRPAYFAGWSYDAAPRWGSHWGHAWESRRSGWDRWDHRRAERAPLPAYQREYSGNRYPRDGRQQAAIQSRSYSYAPRDEYARSRWAERRNDAAIADQTRAQTQWGNRVDVPQSRAEMRRDNEIRSRPENQRTLQEQSQAQRAINQQDRFEQRKRNEQGLRPGQSNDPENNRGSG